MFVKVGSIVTQKDPDTYSSSTTYSNGDEVSFNGKIYQFHLASYQTVEFDLTGLPTQNTRQLAINATNTGTAGNRIFQTFNNFQNGGVSNAVNAAGEINQILAIDNPTVGASGGYLSIKTESATVNNYAADLDEILTKYWSVNSFTTLSYDKDVNKFTFYKIDKTDIGTVSFINQNDQYTFNAVNSTKTDTKDGLDPDVSVDWTKVSDTIADADLSKLFGISGVTKTYDGLKTIYHCDSSITTLEVESDLTINPEVNRIHMIANEAIKVKSTGYLKFGVRLENEDRFTNGVAVAISRAQTPWYGTINGTTCSIVVESGGKFEVSGAEIIAPGMPSFLAGSHIWLAKMRNTCQDLLAGEIDPQTGDVTAGGVGTNTGVTSINTLGSQTDKSRGYTGWWRATDIRVDDYIQEGGGEVTFRAVPSGTNTLSGTPNGYFGYTAKGLPTGGLTHNALTDFEFNNTAIAKNGNGKDWSLQSGQVSNGLTSTTIFNELKGSELQALGAEANLNGDFRNWGYFRLNRKINFKMTNAIDGLDLSGGRYYCTDINNGERKPSTVNSLFSKDDTANNIYSGTLSSSGDLATDEDIIIKIVNVASGTKRPGNTNNALIDERTATPNVEGTNIDLGGTAPSVGDRVTVIVNGTKTNFIATEGQQVYTINVPVDATTTAYVVEKDNIVWIGDQRFGVGVEGQDLSNWVYWSDEYNPVFFNNFNLTDQTVGTLVLTASILKDTNYSSTNPSKTTVDNADELYDAIKQDKSSNDANILLPTPTTLHVSKSGDFLDLGSKNFQVVPSFVSRYIVGITTIVVKPTSTFGAGLIFKGIKTTGTFDCTNVSTVNLDLDATTITNFPTNSLFDILKGTFTETANTSDTTYTLANSTDVSDFVFIGNSTGTITIKGKKATDYGTAPTNIGTGDIVVDPDNATTFQINSASPSGWGLLYNVTDSVITAEMKHTTGTATILLKINNVTSGSKTYRIYYQPENDLTNAILGNRKIYATSIAPSTANDGVNNITIAPTHLEHSDLLTSDAEQVTAGSESVKLELASSSATIGKIVISGANTQPAISSARTLRLLMGATQTTGTAGVYNSVGNDLAIALSNFNNKTATFTSSDFGDISTATIIVLSNGWEFFANQFTVTGSGTTRTVVIDVSSYNWSDLATAGTTTAQFGIVTGIEAESDNYYLRLLANNNITTNPLLPAPGNVTSIDTDYLSLKGLHLQYIGAVDFIGTGTKIDKLPSPNQAIDSVSLQLSRTDLTKKQTAEAVNESTKVVEIETTVEAIQEKVDTLENTKILDLFEMEIISDSFIFSGETLLQGYSDGSFSPVVGALGSIEYQHPPEIGKILRKTRGLYIDSSYSPNPSLVLDLSIFNSEDFDSLPNIITLLHQGDGIELIKELTSNEDYVVYSIRFNDLPTGVTFSMVDGVNTLYRFEIESDFVENNRTDPSNIWRHRIGEITSGSGVKTAEQYLKTSAKTIDGIAKNTQPEDK